MLEIMGFSLVSHIVRNSLRSGDEMTGSDTVCPRLPEFGTSGGTSAEDILSSVPVALIVWRTVKGDEFKSRDGSESNAPYTSSNFGSVYVFIVRSMVE